MISDERLRELERIASAATEGPWHAYHVHNENSDNDFSWDEVVGLGWSINELQTPMRGQVKRGADALFIQEARTAVPQLIMEIRWLRDEIQELKDEQEELMRERDDLQNKRDELLDMLENLYM